MSLALVGKHSLDELERMAKEHFHDIFNKNLVQPDYDSEEVFNKEFSF